MSVTAVILAVGGAILAFLGGLLGHRLGKSSGVTEGRSQVTQTQQIEQAQATMQAVKERTNVEKTVSADSDDELDARLSNHNRAD